MPHPDDEHIAQHAASLRALAKNLIGAGDAADLLQDVNLAALQQRPRDASAIGSWLRAVLRHKAHKLRRSQARRREREPQAAAASSTRNAPAAIDVATHRETIARLQSALLELPDPYQEALFARYFEGLTPTQIAGRTNESLATVKSRLRRGLEDLRGRLQSSIGPEWRAGFIVAFGFGKAMALPAAPITALLLMATSIKLLVATLATVMLAWWLWPTNPTPISRTSNAATSTTTASRAEIATPPQRQAVVTAPASAIANQPTITAAQGVTIIGRCIDARGISLAGVRATGMLFGLSGEGVTEHAQVTTSADGMFELLLPASPGQGHAITLNLEEHCKLDGSFFRSKAGDRIELGDLTIPVACAVAGSILDAKGTLQPGVLVDLRVTIASSANVKPFQAHIRATSGSDGRFVADRRLPPGDYTAWLLNRKNLTGGDATFTIGPDQRECYVELRVEAALPQCHGIVVDESGLPIASAGVTLEGARFSPFVETDANGQFTLDPDPNWAKQYRVAAGERGYHSTSVDWDVQRADEPLRIVLRRQPELRLRVADAITGDAITRFAAWRLKATSHGNVPLIKESEHPGGLALLPSKAGKYFVVVDATDDRYATSAMIPVTVRETTGDEVLVQLSPVQTRRLVVQARGKPVGDAHVELVDCGGIDVDFETEICPIGKSRVFGHRVGCLLQEGTTDADGTLLLRGPVGPLTLRISKGGLALQFVQPISLAGDGDIIVQAVTGAVLAGRIEPLPVARRLWAAHRDEADRAFGRAGLQLRSVEGIPLQRSIDDNLPITEDGSFRIEGIPAGTWDLVFVGDVRFAIDSFTVTEGEELEKVFDANVLIKRTVDLRVMIDGQPVSKRIRYHGVHAIDARGQRFRSNGKGTPDDSGRLTVSTFAGELFVDIPWTDAAGDSHSLRGHVVVPAESVGELLLDLRTGALNLLCVGPKGKPAAGATLRLSFSPFLPPRQFDADAAGRLRLPLADGRYSLFALPQRLSTLEARQQLVDADGYEALEAAWLPITELTVAGKDEAARIVHMPVDWSH